MTSYQCVPAGGGGAGAQHRRLVPQAAHARRGLRPGGRPRHVCHVAGCAAAAGCVLVGGLMSAAGIRGRVPRRWRASRSRRSAAVRAARAAVGDDPTNYKTFGHVLAPWVVPAAAIISELPPAQARQPGTACRPPLTPSLDWPPGKRSWRAGLQGSWCAGLQQPRMTGWRLTAARCNHPNHPNHRPPPKLRLCVHGQPRAVLAAPRLLAHRALHAALRHGPRPAVRAACSAACRQRGAAGEPHRVARRMGSAGRSPLALPCLAT